jgi:hypothetical protein
MQCPACKADNNQGPQCRRCKTDLSLLFRLEEQRARLLAEARADLAAGRCHEAAERAAEADGLHSADDSRRLAAVAYLLTRDFAAAWGSYRAIQAGRSERDGVAANGA